MIAPGQSHFPAQGGGVNAPFRWLVRSPNPLGDACMSLPAVRALKRSRPGIHLTVSCRANLAPMWEAQEEVDAVIPFAKSLNPLQVGKLLRSHGPFDAGLLLPNSFRSALELRLGGVKPLTGYSRYQRGILLGTAVTEEASPAGKEHHVHRYLQLVAAIGVPIEPLEEMLAIPPAPTPILPDDRVIYLGLCPGAEYGNAKRYPIERYAAAVETLRARRPEKTIHVAIFGSPAERGIGEDLAALLAEPRVNRAGETCLAGLVEELQACHLVATNDTGTMHLAAALGVPTVAIFGSTEPDFTAPIGEVHRVIRKKVDCSPCFLRECPIDYRCMLRIEPEEVVGEMEALLDAADRER
jgi:heptosyltransferase-2